MSDLLKKALGASGGSAPANPSGSSPAAPSGCSPVDPSIPLEKKLREQISNALQAEYLEGLIAQIGAWSSDNYWRNQLEGHSFKVEPDIMPRLYNIFQEVKQKLNFTEPIEFYITGTTQVNAFSVKARREGEPHIVNVNSGLVDLMTEDELRFVVGHEIGHLINQDSNMLNLIYFVFPPGSTMLPLMLQYKVRLWSQTAELVADRYGYLAIPDLRVCVSAFFKMTSGLRLAGETLDIDAYIKANLRHLDYFVNQGGRNLYDHPADPVRVQSLNLFATAGSQEQLDEGMKDIISSLLKLYCGEEGRYLARFVATAGLLVAGADKQIDTEELNTMLNYLSQFEIFPRAYLDDLLSKTPEETVKICNECIAFMMENDPGRSESMLLFVIDLVISDRKFTGAELDMLNKIGQALGYQPREIAEIFAGQVQRKFTPSLDSMC